ncbi:hypothetical protein [Arthrobacter koreensis]|uniref:hypothetical protein n=1 Tax=Arthrobacter koreensis TaxID=199136 RepID=UPI0037F386BB
MNQNEYEQFCGEDRRANPPLVTAEDVGGDNRTLAYGYDVDRNTFHVYVHEGSLYVLTYSSRGEIISNNSGPELQAQLLRPNKRVYPQYTDGRFARIMRDLDFPLPFTTWSEPQREGPYYGHTHLKDLDMLQG